MKIIHCSAVLLLLAACASPDAGRITYTQEGDVIIATLSDGTVLRAPCVLSQTRTVTRIGNQRDYCELADDQRQVILERQREITERERQAATSP